MHLLISHPIIKTPAINQLFIAYYSKIYFLKIQICIFMYIDRIIHFFHVLETSKTFSKINIWFINSSCTDAIFWVTFAFAITNSFKKEARENQWMLCQKKKEFKIVLKKNGYSIRYSLGKFWQEEWWKYIQIFVDLNYWNKYRLFLKVQIILEALSSGHWIDVKKILITPRKLQSFMSNHIGRTRSHQQYIKF